MSEVLERSTEIAVLPATAISTIVAADKDDILGKLAAKIAAFKPDISTPKGRDAIRSLAAEVATSKMDLIRLGKSLTETWRKSTSAVNAECKVIEDRMDALKIKVRESLTAWENREKDRVAAHEAALALLIESPLFYAELQPSTDVMGRLHFLDTLPQRDWEEFKDRAAETITAEVSKTKALLTRCIAHEQQQVELARLRAEKEEHDRQEAARLQAEREARIAAEAAESARLAAEAEAKRKADEAAAEVERTRLAAEAEAARVLREAEERAAAEKAAIERKAKEAADAADRERQRIEREAREAQEASDRREREAEAKAKREREEADGREAAQKRRAEAAERQAQAAREQAERDAAAAVERERKRAADELAAQKRDEERRAADKAHRAKINNEAMQDLIDAGMSDAAARAAVVAIAKGVVRHARINY